MDIFNFLDNFFEKSKENSLESMKAKHGGKIETTYQKLTKIKKVWTSEDGTMLREYVSFIEGEPDENEIRLQTLLEEKKEALKKEDYERCAEIKKEIEALKKS
jgi:protein-arginine kinase activator protein McsA